MILDMRIINTTNVEVVVMSEDVCATIRIFVGAVVMLLVIESFYLLLPRAIKHFSCEVLSAEVVDVEPIEVQRFRAPVSTGKFVLPGGTSTHKAFKVTYSYVYDGVTYTGVAEFSDSVSVSSIIMVYVNKKNPAVSSIKSITG